MNLLKKVFQFPAPFLKTFSPVWFVALIVLAGADLASKKIATDNLRFYLSFSQKMKAGLTSNSFPKYAERPKVDILGPEGKYIKFRLVFNDRFAFSLGPANSLVSFFVSLFALFLLILYRAHNPTLGHGAAWLLVFSGAIGNLIDKLFVKSLTTGEWVFSLFPKKGHVGGVVDFIECIWFGIHSLKNTAVLNILSWDTWPTFNLADSMVSVGIVLLILTMKFEK